MTSISINRRVAYSFSSSSCCAGKSFSGFGLLCALFLCTKEIWSNGSQ